MKKYLFAILLMLLVVNIAVPIFAQSDISNAKARVIINNGVEEIEEKDKPIEKIQKLIVRILEGEYEDEEYNMLYVITEDINGNVSNIELNEDDTVIVKIEEQEGEVTIVSYVRTINQSYYIYISLLILIVLVLIILNKSLLKPILIYILAIFLIGYSLIFTIKNGWDLILISSIISFLITIIVFIKIEGINKRTVGLIVCGVSCAIISYIIINIILNLVNLTNINIKIFENFISIKELICSANILLGTGFANIIMIISLNKYTISNKSYKTKSDNIIEGQRSLKL